MCVLRWLCGLVMAVQCLAVHGHVPVCSCLCTGVCGLQVHDGPGAQFTADASIVGLSKGVVAAVEAMLAGGCADARQRPWGRRRMVWVACG